jgi:hypothetical protein
MSLIGRCATPLATAAFGHRRRDLHHQARVERLGDQVVGAERQLLAGVGGGDHLALLGLRQVGDGVHRGDLHLVGDRRRAAVQRAAEDVREAQDVVDLVREVGAAGGQDGVGPHRRARSGMISGFGLASARISGSLAMPLIISGLSTPLADRPRKMSAPSSTSASVRAEVFCANGSLSSSISSLRPS